MVLNITMEQMGNFTIIVSFSGTTHYHASNAALQQWVMGRTEVSADMPIEIDRSLVSGHLSWGEISVSFTTMGLSVGLYTLNITVERSEIRVGCTALLEFSVVSSTHIEIIEQDLTGFISESHSVTFVLRDSLNDTIVDVPVWVSVFNPSDREIYGSPLTDRTAITSTIEGSEVSWTPNLTGEFRVVLLFEGDSFLNSTSLEIVINVRYTSSLTVEAPTLMEFGELIPISATLNGVLGKISGAIITITVTQGGVVERVETLTTNSHGVASIDLVGLLSGNHTIMASFMGSATQAPCSSEVNVLVTPVVVLDIDPTSDLYVGHYCTVNLSVTVLGTTPDWNGTVNALLTDPEGEEAGQWSFEIGVYSTVTIGFNARVLGIYILNTTIGGLPIVNTRAYPLSVTVVDEVLQLQLDAGTTPLLGGFGILAIVGIVLRKKMRGIVGSLPGEWSD
jgi:hypothetical protein